MNDMFNFNPQAGESIASPYLYIFFAVTVPVTAAVYVAWFWWFNYNQKQFQKRHEEGLGDIEKKLRLAVRSATGTW
jgi:hypothetical protein